MPDNESGAKIDTAATTEAVTAITEAIRQCVKDLDAEVERINAAREAMPPPIDRAATSIRLKPHRRVPHPGNSDVKLLRAEIARLLRGAA